jgi:hypothetical protein
MSDVRTYTGGCHCGNVRYEVTTKLEGAITCNCSICSKTGSRLSFVPAEQFKLLSGEDSLRDYQFNKKVIHNLYCTTSGIRSFARGKGPDGKEMAAINVNCLDDVDLAQLPVQQYNGRAS